ncbi:hypothetical protein KUTeg_000721 [Tegillarca granosa]|uniref:Uncharacterized protein n=1 Tax=Tegillarca granosa TaxID=220873 RepID=A0ABQ9FYE2_TEGGR|nr:hypothetical protein KUTeg_000721 [Tegillarca granosa]
MANFGSMERDLLSETFDLLEDMNVGNFDWKKLKRFSTMSADDFFKTPLDSFSFKKRPVDRERSRTLTSDFFSSSPHFSSSPNFSSTSKTRTETDCGDGFFKRTKFRRSESNYSTSSCDTNSSNETYSDNSDSRRSSVVTDENIRSSHSGTGHQYSGTSHYHPATSHHGHNRTASQSSNVDLSKKLENQFLKEERHSMPHEIYSNCDRNLNDLDRPRSVPLNPNDPRNSNNWKDSGSNFKCFPSKIMDSRDLGSFRGNRLQSLDGVDEDGFSDSTETGLLRAQDKVLLSQLQRCQDTIEDIKKQRRLSESEEEEWEDWEIAEFDRREKEASEASQSPNRSFETQPSEESELKCGIKQDVQADI